MLSMFDLLNEDADIVDGTDIPAETAEEKEIAAETAAVEEIEPVEGEDIDESFVRTAMESEQNYHALREAIIMDEVRSALNEADGDDDKKSNAAADKIKAVFKRIKEFLLNLFAKIKGIFTKLFNHLQALVKSDKGFVESFEKKLKDYSGSIKFKGYAFNMGEINKTSDIRPKVSKVYVRLTGALDGGTTRLNQLANDSKEYRENPDVDLREIRKTATGIDCERKEFAVKLEEKYKGAAKKEITITKDVVTTSLNEIKSSKTSIKNSKDAYSKVKKSFDGMIKDIKDTEKKATDGIKKNEGASIISGAAGICIEIVQYCSSIASTVSKVQIRCIRANRAQAKSICVRAANSMVSMKHEKKAANESFIESVELI